MPPKAPLELLNTNYALIFGAVARNGGMVNLMVDDGVIALFGVPEALPNAAQEMRGRMAMLNEERMVVGAPELRVGFDITTGEVIAGYAGTDARASYTCIGQTVNLATRLKAHTKVAQRDILFGIETHAQLDSTAQCRKMPLT